jgi:iron complex outermembrane receptor protein
MNRSTQFFNVKRIVASVGAATVLAGNAPLALAQSGSANVLEEVIVTSRRVAESLQDVPVAVTSMDSEFLETQGINNVDDAILYTPGGAFTAFNKMQQEYSLRGISSQSEGASGDSSVATVIDNVAISKEFLKNPAFFDMSRIEILRGPQGTTFGRNASSGLVHLMTARPLDEFEARVKVDAGSYDLANFEGSVTGPLSDNLSGRLAVNYDYHEGYTDDTRTGKDLGEEQNSAIRGSLLWNPSDSLEIFLKAEYSEDSDERTAVRRGQDCTIPYQLANAPSIVGAPQPNWEKFPSFTDSCDVWETQVSTPTYLGSPKLDRDITNLTAEVVWDVTDGVSATTVIGYISGESDYLIDTHGGPNNSMFQSTQNDADQFSVEIRLDNHASADALRWLGGVYYLQDEHTRDDQNIWYVEQAALFGGPGNIDGYRPETRDFKYTKNETTAFGLFATVDYDFSDTLSLSLGGRYSYDEKEYEVAHTGFGWGGPIELISDEDADGNPINGCFFAPGADAFVCGTASDPIGYSDPVKTDDDWNNFSLKASLNYNLSDDVLLYGLVSQGYKTGGFQPEPPTPSDALVPFDEETVINYELGLKGEWGGVVRVNAALFYTEYEDLQVFNFVTTPSGNYSQVVDNASDAEISGLEVEVVWQIMEQLRVEGSYSNINAELVDYAVDTDGDGELDTDFSGNRPDNTPEWTSTFAITYDMPFDNGSLFSLRADWRGSSETFDGNEEDPDRRHDSYDVVGARASWLAPSESFSLSLWGRNLTEEEYTVNVGPAQPNLNQLNFAYGAPRTYGVTVDYRF